jgi:hypothetical protein
MLKSSASPSSARVRYQMRGYDRAFNVAVIDEVLNVPAVSATTVSPVMRVGGQLMTARIAPAIPTLNDGKDPDALETLML